MASDQVAAPTAEPEKVEKEKTEAKKSGGDAADKEEQDQVGKSAVPNEHEDKPLTARIPSPVIGPLPPPDFVLPSEPESREEQRKSEGDSVMSAEDREELSLVCEHCLETARMIQQGEVYFFIHPNAP